MKISNNNHNNKNFEHFDSNERQKMCVCALKVSS